jgi:hypothetical protein
LPFLTGAFRAAGFELADVVLALLLLLLAPAVDQTQHTRMSVEHASF